MSDYIKILTIENEMDGIILKSMLEEANIPYQYKSYHDTAYDGLFQTQMGKGDFLAPKEYQDVILHLYNSIKTSK